MQVIYSVVVPIEELVYRALVVEVDNFDDVTSAITTQSSLRGIHQFIDASNVHLHITNNVSTRHCEDKT
jgi:hypothetical protein